MNGDLCVDEDEQFTDVALPEVFTRPSLDDDEHGAATAAAQLDSIYTRITALWHELETVERALRIAEPTSQRARHTRAWVREALGGLEYPVFRGLDEARCAMDYGTRNTSPPPATADKPYRLTMPSALHHHHHGGGVLVAAPRPDDHDEPRHTRWAGMLRLIANIRTPRRGAAVGNTARRPRPGGAPRSPRPPRPVG